MAGVVTADELEGLAARGGAGAPVTVAIDEAPRVVHPGEDPAGALQALSSGQASAVVVVDGHDQVIGLVTPSEVKRAALLGRLSRQA